MWINRYLVIKPFNTTRINVFVALRIFFNRFYVVPPDDLFKYKIDHLKLPNLPNDLMTKGDTITHEVFLHEFLYLDWVTGSVAACQCVFLIHLHISHWNSSLLLEHWFWTSALWTIVFCSLHGNGTQFFLPHSLLKEPLPAYHSNHRCETISPLRKIKMPNKPHTTGLFWCIHTHSQTFPLPLQTIFD